ncbi:hypothetical protein KP79_PYT21617 [Mizuhopecten yessoensis]|uniref:Uncharacterized protein n=1 Tax=Mizuhopecten yessoensis TaxID=6573 RepID=A0A210R0C2_MIZYE|nr:hypothetical protein KP79_PYT21617 [Mizuhopecten yessoensis]
MMLEAESFSKMALHPNQPLDDFYSRLIHRGKVLHKRDEELMIIFIDSLPIHLKFFVRDGHPKQQKLPWLLPRWVKLMVYRESKDILVQAITPSLSTSSPHSSASTLEQKLSSLTYIVSKLVVTVSESRELFTCPECGGQDRRSPMCNLNGQGVSCPDTICQLCSQKGYVAASCKTLLTVQEN